MRSELLKYIVTAFLKFIGFESAESMSELTFVEYSATLRLRPSSLNGIDLEKGKAYALKTPLISNRRLAFCATVETEEE